MFAFGIEHEVAFIRADGQFADFTNTTFAEFDQIIAQLPIYPADYPQLHVGDAGIRKKRWYIEGLERFSDTGDLIGFAPKGIEIRTTPHSTIQAAIAELTISFDRLRDVASAYGFTPVALSFNPYRTEFMYDPPLNAYEQQLRDDEPEYQTEHLPMVTYGPDCNLSIAGLPFERVIDLGQKLTFYSPILVAFSLNAPLYAGRLWDGLSVRTATRTGVRPAVRVYVKHEQHLVPSTPILTKLARNQAEIGRIEFKAFDSVADFGLYAGLLALLKGLALDDTLPGRATVPDAALHQRVARAGFADDWVAQSAATTLAAAVAALGSDPDAVLLAPLTALLARRESPAHAFIRRLHRAGSVERLFQMTLRDSVHTNVTT
jgi:hypothetical protein